MGAGGPGPPGPGGPGVGGAEGEEKGGKEEGGRRGDKRGTFPQSFDLFTSSTTFQGCRQGGRRGEGRESGPPKVGRREGSGGSGAEAGGERRLKCAKMAQITNFIALRAITTSEITPNLLTVQ